MPDCEGVAHSELYIGVKSGRSITQPGVIPIVTYLVGTIYLVRTWYVLTQTYIWFSAICTANTNNAGRVAPTKLLSSHVSGEIPSASSSK